MSGNRPYIVVGVDGSQASKDALRWAARQADLTGAELRVIGAWELVPTYPYPVVIDADLADRTRTALATAVDEVFGPEPPPYLVVQAQRGHPAHVLVEASRGAEMLIVGASGHGTFADMLLGSVSQHCAHHATCPLVIVRQPKPAS